MVKRIFQGLAVVIVLALVILLASVFRFDRNKEELLATYSNSASQFITLAGGAVAHVRDQGNKAGPVLVLVHGSNSSLHTWEPWAAILGADYRIVTMDMPGHGLTGAVPNEDYSRTGMVAFVHEITRKLGLTRYAIGGNSMGGGVAAQYAEAYPDEVFALILVDASGIPRKHQQGEKIPLGFRLARMPGLNRILLYVTPRSIIEEGLRKVFVDQSIITDAMVARYYDLALYDGNRRATGIRFRLLPNDEEVAGKLGTIKAPTLILWGEKDGLIPVEYAGEFARRIAGSKVVIYPNVGHIPMEEIAGKSAADVQSFLQMNK